jgi:RimJ/RimL family protein N-acetyltransferase
MSSLGTGSMPIGLQLETDRLILRPPRIEDFEPWVEFAADAEATRFLGGPQPRAVVWRTFLTLVGAWQIQGFAMFSVIEKASGRWIGRIGPWKPEGWPGTEVGWSLVRDVWDRGYAREAATASIDWAFTTLGWEEVIHSIHPANAASIRLAERLGSVYRGPGQLPPPYAEEEVGIWAQSRAKWMAGR